MYMLRTQLYLADKQRKALKAEARRSGKSVGQLVREAVDEVYLTRKAREKPIGKRDPIWRMVGRGKSREGDISERHDHYLYGRDDEVVR